MLKLATPMMIISLMAFSSNNILELQSLFLLYLSVKVMYEFCHYFSYLILLEALMISLLVGFILQYTIATSSSVWAFIMMVIMVMGACVGLSIMVIMMRTLGSNMELTKLKI